MAIARRVAEFVWSVWSHARLLVTSSLVLFIGLGLWQATDHQVRPIAYFLLLLIALTYGAYKAWRFERDSKPKHLFWIHKVHTQATDNTGGGRSVWIQLELQHEMGALIEQCQGHLLKIWHRWPKGRGLAGEEWEESDIEPQALMWSMKITEPDEPVTLIPGKRINICWIHDNQKDWIQLCINPQPLRAYQQLSQAGRFRFDVLIRAKACEDIYASVEVERGDPWDKPTVELHVTDVEKERIRKKILLTR